jgi:hypothetical protein
VVETHGVKNLETAELPEPPPFTLRNAVTVIGPGAILAGLCIGSGEWLLGPAVTVKYGLSLLWIVSLALLLQLVLNFESIRYTLATGEPIFAGLLRLKPGASYWAWFWSAMLFFQIGTAGWAGTGASALAALYLGALPGQNDAPLIAWIGLGVFLLAVVLVAFGQRVEHFIESVNHVVAVATLIYLAFVALLFLPASQWSALGWGFLGWGERGFEPLPAAPDFFLLGALAAYSGSGGTMYATLSYWVRDKGLGMSGLTGHQSVMAGGKEILLSQPGVRFTPTEECVRKWTVWLRFTTCDQLLFWLAGALLAMALPSLLASAFLPAGTEIRGPAVAAELARGLLLVNGWFWWITLIAGAWILVATQIAILDGFSQIITDLIWSGVQSAQGLPVRNLYWGVLGLITLAGIFFLSAPLFGLPIEPIFLIQLSANWAGVNLIFLSIQTIIVNRTLLPAALKPSLWREILLGVCALFFLASTSAWLFFSEEAKLVTPYAVSFLLIAFLVGLGVGGRKEPTADR